MDSKKLFNGFLKDYNFEESIVLINLFEATYKEVDNSKTVEIVKKYILDSKKFELIYEVLNLKYYILNNNVNISNNTKFICLETDLENKKRYEWFYNRSHQILARNISYNLIDDFIGCEECAEFKLYLMAEDFDSYTDAVGSAFSQESNQYKFLYELKQNLSLLLSCREEEFIEGLNFVNSLLEKYKINICFKYYESLEKAIEFMKKELTKSEINYNEIFNEIYFK